MELTTGQLLNAKDILTRLGNQKMKAVTAYRLQKNITKIQPVLLDFEKALNGLIAEYGVKEGNDVTTIPDDNKEAYIKELNELLAEPVSIEITQINAEDIDGDFAPFEFMTIEWMLI